MAGLASGSVFFPVFVSGNRSRPWSKSTSRHCSVRISLFRQPSGREDEWPRSRSDGRRRPGRVEGVAQLELFRFAQKALLFDCLEEDHTPSGFSVSTPVETP